MARQPLFRPVPEQGTQIMPDICDNSQRLAVRRRTCFRASSLWCIRRPFCRASSAREGSCWSRYFSDTRSIHRLLTAEVKPARLCVRVARCSCTICSCTWPWHVLPADNNRCRYIDARQIFTLEIRREYMLILSARLLTLRINRHRRHPRTCILRISLPKSACAREMHVSENWSEIRR